jgi:hypothetical protein
MAVQFGVILTRLPHGLEMPYHDGCLPSYKFLVHLYAALRSGKDESKFSSLCQNLKICFNISK